MLGRGFRPCQAAPRASTTLTFAHSSVVVRPAECFRRRAGPRPCRHGGPQGPPCGQAPSCPCTTPSCPSAPRRFLEGGQNLLLATRLGDRHLDDVVADGERGEHEIGNHGSSRGVLTQAGRHRHVDRLALAIEQLRAHAVWLSAERQFDADALLSPEPRVGGGHVGDAGERSPAKQERLAWGAPLSAAGSGIVSFVVSPCAAPPAEGRRLARTLYSPGVSGPSSGRRIRKLRASAVIFASPMRRPCPGRR